MAETYREVLAQAAKENMSHLAFLDATVAPAVLDRPAHPSEILVIDGKSYRTGREDTSE